MSSNRESMSTPSNESQQMAQLRHLVLGDDCQIVRDVVEEEARDLVTNVLTEALHDRQKADGSVTAVIAPLVEQSVESSVVARKEQFVSYLYPLVGSLVRKSVSSFLAEIIEQTNELLESSLTYKGLKWRFEARRAGVRYSQYVVQQTFVFRVEQVLLIHRETGMLLKTVMRDKTQATDGDMVSAMLTAINDFVADSFSPQENDQEQSLDEIKTDDFTLLIKQGPNAILVGAITGNPPAGIGDKFQLTLESIHQIYNDELNNYEGDSSEFENTEQQLNDCLLAQQKESKTEKKKMPWLAIVLFLIGFAGIGAYFYHGWQLDSVANEIRDLPSPPGVVLLNANTCDDKVCVDVLRDPIALPVSDWIAGVSDMENIDLSERYYRSLDERLLPLRFEKMANEFPELQFDAARSAFLGALSQERYLLLRSKLLDISDAEMINKILANVLIEEQNSSSSALLIKVMSDVRQLPEAPGIALIGMNVCGQHVCIDVLRDPDAQKVTSWLGDVVSSELITINERRFSAYDERLIPRRLARIDAAFPNVAFDAQSHSFSGVLSAPKFDQLRSAIQRIQELVEVDSVLRGVSIKSQRVDSGVSNELLIEQQIREVELSSVPFDVNASQLPSNHSDLIKSLSREITRLAELAKVLDQRLLVVVMGTSTLGGTDSYNQQLSLDRADSVIKALISEGVSPEILRTAGLGALKERRDAPKVIFDVIRFSPEGNREVRN
ncbi:OmpA/MotB domain protein [Marinomonas mediterranea MMB-1]|uniref:OmpA/MotB domain protein n=2 Tax=Marinomonas mediterranea TaxID=119864 RepID=F2JUS7_MARM1|nr:OmpA/MotB domain protein [Marinomonas mediterranea MMB-1]